MITLNQENATDNIVVTLNEKKSITDAYYLFVFTNVTTKRVVKKIFASNDDLSGHPTRYNEFAFPTASLFANEQAGQWQYEVYEQASAVNTDTTGLAMVERGKMTLNADPNHSFTGYAPDTQYKGYAG